MIKGVIFDIDGTLLDTMPFWTDVGARYLKSIHVEAREDLGRILFSMTLEEGTRYLKEAYSLPYTEEEIRRGILDQIAHFYQQEADFKPGMKEILRKYHEAGIPMVLATTNDRQLAVDAFTRLGVMDWFHGIYTATELNTSKKEPFIYETAAISMGTLIEETAVYEDVLHAIATAKKAGFHTVAVYDSCSEDDWDEIIEIADETIGDTERSL